MIGVLRQVWQVAQATLAVCALVAAALYSAEKVDREGLNPFAMRAIDPPTTGSIAPPKLRQ